MSRIKYYSSNDLSTGNSLVKYEEILNNFDEAQALLTILIVSFQIMITLSL